MEIWRRRRSRLWVMRGRRANARLRPVGGTKRTWGGPDPNDDFVTLADIWPDCSVSLASLPARQGGEGMDELDDVERQVVADHDGKEKLDGDRQGHCVPRRHAVGQGETGHHRQRIGYRIDHAVAKRRLAVAVDDEWRVLDDLPAHL